MTIEPEVLGKPKINPMMGNTLDEVAQARQKIESMMASLSEQLVEAKALEAIMLSIF